MSYTMMNPIERCANCGITLYVEEVEHPSFDGRCMECDPKVDPAAYLSANSSTGGNKMFKVYSPRTHTEDVFFKLRQVDDLIRLVAVRANGAAYPAANILNIMPDGRIQLCSGVNKNIGLQLDANRKVRVF